MQVDIAMLPTGRSVPGRIQLHPSLVRSPSDSMRGQLSSAQAKLSAAYAKINDLNKTIAELKSALEESRKRALELEGRVADAQDGCASAECMEARSPDVIEARPAKRRRRHKKAPSKGEDPAESFDPSRL